MDSSFKALLDKFGINVGKFEQFKIYSLSKLMDKCITEYRKKMVLDLLDIDELDFDCLLKGLEENETLAQFDDNYPDINNLKEENIN